MSRSVDIRGNRDMRGMMRDMKRPRLKPFDAWIGVGNAPGYLAARADPLEWFKGVSPPFENSWVNVSNSANNNSRPRAAFYMSPDGEVRLKGAIRGGASNSTVFTLPTGFRPEKNMQFIVPNDSGGYTTIEVKADGRVIVLRQAGVTAIG